MDVYPPRSGLQPADNDDDLLGKSVCVRRRRGLERANGSDTSRPMASPPLSLSCNADISDLERGGGGGGGILWDTSRRRGDFHGRLTRSPGTIGVVVQNVGSRGRSTATAAATSERSSWRKNGREREKWSDRSVGRYVIWMRAKKCA